MAADDQPVAVERRPFAFEPLEGLVAAARHEDLPGDEVVPGTYLADEAGPVVKGDQALTEPDELGELGSPATLGDQADQPRLAAVSGSDLLHVVPDPARGRVSGAMQTVVTNSRLPGDPAIIAGHPRSAILVGNDGEREGLVMALIAPEPRLVQGYLVHDRRSSPVTDNGCIG